MHRTCDEDTTIVEYIPEEERGEDSEPCDDPLAEACKSHDTDDADSRFMPEPASPLGAPLVL